MYICIFDCELLCFCECMKLRYGNCNVMQHTYNNNKLCYYKIRNKNKNSFCFESVHDYNVYLKTAHDSMFENPNLTLI